MWAWVYRSLIDKYKFRQYWPQIPRGMWNTDRIRPWKKTSHHAMVNWVQSVRSCWYVLCYKDVSDHGYCMTLTMVDKPIIFIVGGLSGDDQSGRKKSFRNLGIRVLRSLGGDGIVPQPTTQPNPPALTQKIFTHAKIIFQHTKIIFPPTKIIVPPAKIIFRCP